MRIAVLQSNYIPWPGYFQLILNADLVCFYDDVQFTKNDWRNRNIVSTSKGPLWLTVPVHGSTRHNIEDIKVDNLRKWQQKHLMTIKHCYSKFPEYHTLFNFLEFTYTTKLWTSLSQLNQETIKFICKEFFDVEPKFVNSKGIATKKHKQERLFDIIKHYDADSYITGPAVFNYCDGEEFERNETELLIANFQDSAYYCNHKGKQIGISIVEFLSKRGSHFHENMLNPENLQPWRDFAKR